MFSAFRGSTTCSPTSRRAIFVHVLACSCESTGSTRPPVAPSPPGSPALSRINEQASCSTLRAIARYQSKMRKPALVLAVLGKLVRARLRPAFRAARAPIQRSCNRRSSHTPRAPAGPAAHLACGAAWPAARCARMLYPNNCRPVQGPEIRGSAQPASARFATGRKRSRKRSTRSCCTHPRHRPRVPGIGPVKENHVTRAPAGIHFQQRANFLQVG